MSIIASYYRSSTLRCNVYTRVYTYHHALISIKLDFKELDVNISNLSCKSLYLEKASFFRNFFAGFSFLCTIILVKQTSVTDRFYE